MSDTRKSRRKSYSRPNLPPPFGMARKSPGANACSLLVTRDVREAVAERGVACIFGAGNGR